MPRYQFYIWVVITMFFGFIANTVGQAIFVGAWLGFWAGLSHIVQSKRES